MAGSNEITRKLWEIVQNENSSIKERINAFSHSNSLILIVFRWMSHLIGHL